MICSKIGCAGRFCSVGKRKWRRTDGSERIGSATLFTTEEESRRVGWTWRRSAYAGPRPTIHAAIGIVTTGFLCDTQQILNDGSYEALCAQIEWEDPSCILVRPTRELNLVDDNSLITKCATCLRRALDLCETRLERGHHFWRFLHAVQHR